MVKIFFSMGNLGDPLDLLEKWGRGQSLGDFSDVDAEIRRFLAWRNYEVDRILRVAEGGNIDALKESQDEALQLEAALTFTVQKSVRSRLSPEAFYIIEKDIISSIDLIRSASDLMARRIEVLSKPGAIQPNVNIPRKGLSYFWAYENQLPHLFKLLRHGWIPEDVTEEQLSAIFGQKRFSEIVPIRWLGTPMSLMYFLLQSMELGYLYRDPDSSNFDYIQLDGCFKSSVGSDFPKNLRTYKTRPLHGASKKSAAELDFILDSLPKYNR